MQDKETLAAPCGLYCGVCGVYVAHRDNNPKLKERLALVFGVSPEEITCDGCLSAEPFLFCRSCPIKDCTTRKEIEGCHECVDFPCSFIDGFPIPVAKKVILRSVPERRELGTEGWMKAEDERYHCPQCGYPLFRRATRCRECKQPAEVD